MRRRGRIVIILVAVALALLGLKGWQLYSGVRAVRDDLRSLATLAQSQPNRSTLSSLGPLLAKARDDTATLRAEAGPLLPLSRYLGWVPVYGADLVAAPPLLDLAVDLTSAADQSYQALAPLLLDRDRAEPINQGMVVRLVQARPQIERARAALHDAAETWRRIPIDTLSPQLRDPLERAMDALPIAQDGLDLALAVPDGLGASGRSEYLLIAQNADELRATGGFISGAGVLAFDQGRLAEFSIDDSATVDNFTANAYPDPPGPMLHYMNLDVWVFRDANWSPDFPTSARAASDLYKLGQARAIPNVIAFDEVFIQKLLSVIGPVSVAGIPYPISSENVFQELRTPYNLPWDEGREEFKRRLAQVLLGKLQGNPADLDLLALLNVVRRALDERHLLVYVQYPGLARLLAAHGWDGAVRPGDADFLMAVDTNVGYNKVNANIQEELNYTVDLRDPGAPMAELAVHHTHRLKTQEDCRQWGDERGPGLESTKRYAEWMTRCYYDYLRVLIPGGSRLVDSKTQPVPGAWMNSGVGDDGAVTQSEGEAGTATLSTFLVVPFGGERETVFRYRLPAAVLTHDAQGWHYRLKIQKQPGTDAIPLTMTLRLPPGASLLASAPDSTASGDGAFSFALRLDRDQTIDVRFSISSSAK